ncbi:MAG: c-type cytochrome [Flavobacteriales bacterium]|jgi:mono/diheme cytochrome c family protein|nr:c-type cytochrome [Flavobacteriales bacterium]MBK6549270.1 c-type cytochrome [Flavobacteriales bacterium]MBK6884153.1 c-type cytochrome [Flavobacteriales bacterium]MBK7100532.1 c-type cytochrome [Flavobacteriales bacterium]MBK7111229.1 c-type cytochrome [Flavobacteriales bacterium]
MRKPFIIHAIALFMAMPMVLDLSAQDGEAVFKQNCSACHMMGKRLVGPDLTGVTEKRSDAWLRKFIHSSQSMVKSGDPDAVAIFNEFNQMIMIDQPLSDPDLDAVLGYLAGFGKPAQQADASVVVEPEAPIEYTADDIEQGMTLFTGGPHGGGPSCVSCHNAGTSGIPGGLLAKDLTHVYARMGHAGITGIMGAPPFPAMASAYSGVAALTEEEIHALAAYLYEVDRTSPVEIAQAGSGGYISMMIWGLAGLVAIMALAAITWWKRLHNPVRHEIIERQIRSI